MVAEIINGLGAKAYRAGERTFFIDTRNLRFSKINQEYGEKSRASTLFIPALLAKFGQAEVPMPGGDKIGKRPLERHMDGLELMGVKFEQENGMLLLSIVVIHIFQNFQ